MNAHNRVNDASRQLGEQAADEWVLQEYGAPGTQIVTAYPTTPGSRPGDFDRIYEIRDSDGNLTEYVVVEAKGGSSRLGQRMGDDGTPYQQGHPEYFNSITGNMANSGEPTGIALRQAQSGVMEDGSPAPNIRYVLVRAPIDSKADPHAFRTIESVDFAR